MFQRTTVDFSITTALIDLLFLVLLSFSPVLREIQHDRQFTNAANVDSYKQFAVDVWPNADIASACAPIFFEISNSKMHGALERMIDFLSSLVRVNVTKFLDELALAYGTANMIFAASSVEWNPTNQINSRFYTLRHDIGSWLIDKHPQPLLYAYCACNASTSTSSSYSDFYAYIPYVHGYIWQSVMRHAWTSPLRTWHLMFQITRNVVRISNSNLFPPTLDSCFYHPVGHAALYAAYLSRNPSQAQLASLSTSLPWSTLDVEDLSKGERSCEAANGYALVPCYDGLYDAFCGALPNDKLILHISRSGACDMSKSPYLCYRGCLNALRASRHQIHNCQKAIARRECIHALSYKFFLHYHIRAFGLHQGHTSMIEPYYGLMVEQFVPPIMNSGSGLSLGVEPTLRSWCRSLGVLPGTSFWNTCASASLVALASGCAGTCSKDICHEAVGETGDSHELCTAYFIRRGDWAEQDLI